MFVKNGAFQTEALWREVPNTTFTKKGWPERVTVNVRQRPFPQSSIKVHFEAYLNGAWQNKDVLSELGDNDGKNLNGTILKKTEPDVSDSRKIVDYRQIMVLPILSPEARAIDLVKTSVLTLPGEGRSAGDVQANIDLSTTQSGVALGKGWSAKPAGVSDYVVSYDFINGVRGEEQAV